MIIRIDGMDLDSLKFCRCYMDGSLVDIKKINNKGITEFDLDDDGNEHEIRLQLTKATDKKENDSMLSMLISYLAFLSNDVRLDYFTIYHGTNESVEFKVDDLSEGVIEFRVEAPCDEKPYYSLEKVNAPESMAIIKNSDINLGYLSRTYKRYKSLSLTIALILLLIGFVLVLTSNNELHVYRTYATGSYLIACGLIGYLRRNRIAKRQYEICSKELD